MEVWRALLFAVSVFAFAYAFWLELYASVKRVYEQYQRGLLSRVSGGRRGTAADALPNDGRGDGDGAQRTSHREWRVRAHVAAGTGVEHNGADNGGGTGRAPDADERRNQAVTDLRSLFPHRGDVPVN